MILDVIDVLNEFYNVDSSDGWCGPEKAHKKSKLDRPAQNTELLIRVWLKLALTESNGLIAILF